jgi:hypothetical protein
MQGGGPELKHAFSKAAFLALQEQLARSGLFPDPPFDIRSAILADLIHVASEDCYWSIETKCLVSHKTVDDRWFYLMLPSGMLDRHSDVGDDNDDSDEGDKKKKKKKKKLASMSVANWLKLQPDTQRVSRITHRLAQPLIVDDCLNIAPALPERVIGEDEPTLWIRLVYYICKDNEDHAEQIMDWLAMLVTAWDEKPGWHLLLRGKQGVGKGMIMRPMLWYLKPHHQKDVKPVNLDSRFNGFLTRRLISVNELKMNTRGATTGHDIYNVVKGYTSGDSDTITVEYKGMEQVEVRDLSGWVLMSNELTPLPLEEDDRRFMVIETPDEKLPAAEYREISKWLKTGGGNAQVIAWLHKRWDAMPEEWRQVLREAPPMTAAKLTLIDDSASGIAGAIKLALSGQHGTAWPSLMQLNDVMTRLKDPSSDLLTESVRRNYLSRSNVLNALRAIGAKRLFDGVQIKGGGRQMRLWCLRPQKLKMYEMLGQSERLVQRYEEEQQSAQSSRYGESKEGERAD